jgi:hypothetical protein
MKWMRREKFFIPGKTRLAEDVSDLRANFIAIPGDTGAKGYRQIFWSGSKRIYKKIN